MVASPTLPYCIQVLKVSCNNEKYVRGDRFPDMLRIAAVLERSRNFIFWHVTEVIRITLQIIYELLKIILETISNVAIDIGWT
jgi:hypothetical protein